MQYIIVLSVGFYVDVEGKCINQEYFMQINIVVCILIY